MAAWNRGQDVYGGYPPDQYSRPNSIGETPNFESDFYQYKGVHPSATPATLSVASKTLCDEPLAPDNKKKSLLPWRRRNQEKAEAEEKLQTLERLRQIEQQKYHLELGHARARWLAIEEQQQHEEEAARRKEQARREKEIRVIEGQRELERLEAQRKGEIEARRMATSPEALQHLRELVRQRYELDMEIWSHRDVPARDRVVLVGKMKRADTLLREIQETVKAWKIDEEVWTKGEVAFAKDIRERLLKDNKRVWRKQSPWGTTDYEV